MDLPIAIPSMSVLATPKPVRDYSVLAKFTAEIGPLLAVGCALARNADGALRVWMPPVEGKNRLVIQDTTVRLQLVAAASQAFRALSGRDPAEPPVAKASYDLDTFDDPS